MSYFVHNPLVVRLFQPNQKKLARTVLLMSLGLLAFGNLAWSKDVSDWETLSKGQVVVKQMAPATKNEAPSVEAKILISRPPAKVWSVVSDPEKLMADEGKVRKVKVLSRTGNKQNVEFHVTMTPLLPSFNYVLMQELSPPTILRFHRISGSFKDIQGSWQLQPVDNGNKTILSYILKMDPGPFIPKALVMTAVKSDLPNMMRNAKAAIDNN